MSLKAPWQIELKGEVNAGDAYTQPHRAVLHRGTANPDEWVTHLENLEKDGKGGFKSKKRPEYYWGHYFGKDYNKALDDFKIRRAKVAANQLA